MDHQKNIQTYTVSGRGEELQKAYHEAITKMADTCPFCHLREFHHKIIRENKYFYVIENRFPYTIWESRTVTEHLLLLPKQHVIALDDLLPDAINEYVQILAEHSSKGYSIYARSVDNPARSQRHQHTHFIKINPAETVTF